MHIIFLVFYIVVLGIKNVKFSWRPVKIGYLFQRYKHLKVLAIYLKINICKFQLIFLDCITLLCFLRTILSISGNPFHQLQGSSRTSSLACFRDHILCNHCIIRFDPIPVKVRKRYLTPRWPLTPCLLRSHVWLYPRLIVYTSHENTSKYVDTVTLFAKTWTKGHWHLDDLWPHICWGHMCDFTQGSLCPSPMGIHQCMWIQ